MNYDQLLDLAVDIGYELAMCGAETFRVEDTIRHILKSYQVSCEAFAIPNSLTVSIITETGKPITRLRRVGPHGNDLDTVERLNSLSRTICAAKPAPETAEKWLQELLSSRRAFPYHIQLLGHFMGAAGFSVFLGCGFPDIFFAGLCGLVIGITSRPLERLKANPLFTTLAASFCMALTAYLLNLAGLIHNPDTVNIGGLMLLVPGLLFTNAMRDIIYGDTNSGINRIVQVFLIATAIALGTGSAWNLVTRFLHAPSVSGFVYWPLALQCMGAMLGCMGFSILSNIHGPGALLCAFGGVLAWAVYSLVLRCTGNDLTAYFWGAVGSSLYAETMARIRKYPAISYLVVSIFPLIPGAGVYYTMNYALHQQMSDFARQGLHTAAIAGIMAAGILVTSTSVRMIITWRQMHKTA